MIRGQHAMRAAAALLVTALVTAPAHAVGTLYKVCLNVPAGGMYMTGGGTWTRDNVPIGMAFVGGATFATPGVICEQTKLGQAPNDYHSLDVFTSSLGVATTISVWKRWSGHFSGELVFPLLATTGSTDVFLIIDADLDGSALDIVLTLDGKVVYEGPADKAPLDELMLEQIGECRIGRCSIADFQCDGQVGFPDLTQLLGAWGPCPGCIEDIDGDGFVGFSDLSALLSMWG